MLKHPTIDQQRQYHLCCTAMKRFVDTLEACGPITEKDQRTSRADLYRKNIY